MEENNQNLQEEIEKLKNLLEKQTEMNENLLFFSDPLTFNNTLFKGMKIILEKLQKIEEKLGISNANPQ